MCHGQDVVGYSYGHLILGIPAPSPWRFPERYPQLIAMFIGLKMYKSSSYWGIPMELPIIGLYNPTFDIGTFKKKHMEQMGQGANQFLFVQGCHVGDTQIHFVHLASELVTGHVACRNKDTVSIYLFIYICVYIYIYIIYICTHTSSTAQGGGGSFKNRKPIGEIGCCESRMAERIH